MVYIRGLLIGFGTTCMYISYGFPNKQFKNEIKFETKNKMFKTKLKIFFKFYYVPI